MDLGEVKSKLIENKGLVLIVAVVLVVFIAFSVSRCTAVQNERSQTQQQEQQASGASDDVQNAESQLTDEQKQKQQNYSQDILQFISVLKANLWSTEDTAHFVAFTDKTFTERTDQGKSTTCGFAGSSRLGAGTLPLLPRFLRMLWRKGFWLLGVLGGFRGGILRLVQLQGLLTVGFVCSYHGRCPSWSWGACSFCCSRFRGVVVLKAFYLEVLLMAKTVASIEAQIAALMAEKKELEIAERKADKDALGVAESIIGKIVLRIVDANWKRIDEDERNGEAVRFGGQLFCSNGHSLDDFDVASADGQIGLSDRTDELRDAAQRQASVRGFSPFAVREGGER